MTRSTARFGLPELEFLKTDSDEILADLEARYKEYTGRTLARADPVRLFLCAIAAEEAQLRNVVDLACKENLLSYADGDYLDALGAYVNTPRLEASKATATIRFTLSAAQDSAFVIPAGTIVTNGLASFLTDSAGIIEAGDTSIDLAATAQEAGADFNGIPAGSLNTLGDPLPGIASAANTEATSGGADREDDDAYAERIRLAPTAFSVAGPHDSYVYYAKKYSSSISDVCVYGLEAEPGNVYVRPLLTGGELPDDAFLEGLKSYLSSDTIRPLTDNVIVKSPEASAFQINFTWYLDTDSLKSIASITAAVAAAAEEYRLWQITRIGRDINPDRLVKLLIDAGAKRVVITSPTFTALEQYQVAQCSASDITIAFGGTEDE